MFVSCVLECLVETSESDAAIRLVFKFGHALPKCFGEKLPVDPCAFPLGGSGGRARYLYISFDYSLKVV